MCKRVSASTESVSTFLLSYANHATIKSVQVNMPAESGDMGILANHVASIEQLRPGIVEVIEESGGNKQYFRMIYHVSFSAE